MGGSSHRRLLNSHSNNLRPKPWGRIWKRAFQKRPQEGLRRAPLPRGEPPQSASQRAPRETLPRASSAARASRSPARGPARLRTSPAKMAIIHRTRDRRHRSALVPLSISRSLLPLSLDLSRSLSLSCSLLLALSCSLSLACSLLLALSLSLDDDLTTATMAMTRDVWTWLRWWR